ncbi:hypothetical protein [Clostridium hydrogeniformans]|uniref:hypothetical protein n=1 Tax=Clostridium hydrogeniformans TaxID=349933 RepID=UPI0005567961|nr:hypothetical protein [Clostridium hydrogeniformans]
MDITTLLSGLSNGKIDKNMADTISSCFDNEGRSNNNSWLIILLLLFSGGFGGNNCGGGGGFGNCGGGCGYPGSGYYTYYDPCVRGSNCSFNSNLNYVQPNYCYPQGGCFQPNYYGNNCGSGCEIFFLIILIFLLGGRGFRSNCNNRNCGDCSELDFTQIN